MLTSLIRDSFTFATASPSPKWAIPLIVVADAALTALIVLKVPCELEALTL